MIKKDTFKVTIQVANKDPMADEVIDTFIYHVPLVEGQNPLNAFMDYVRGKSEAIEQENNKIELAGGNLPPIIV